MAASASPSLLLLLFAPVVAAVLLVQPALAAEPRATVTVTAAPDAESCPDAVTIATASSRTLGRADGVRAAAADDASGFEVSFARKGDGYGVTITNRGSPGATRTLATSENSCAALTDATAIALAMMVEDAEASAPPVEAARAVSPTAESPVPIVNPAPRAARTAHDHFFAEGFGNGLYYSLDYEHLFGEHWSARAGFMVIRMRTQTWSLGSIVGGSVYGAQTPRPFFTELSLPLVGSYYLGTASHKLQLGAGATVFYRSGPPGDLSLDSIFNSATARGLDVAGTLVVAYRYLPYKGGPTIGGGFTPLFGHGGFLPWISLDIGAVF